MAQQKTSNSSGSVWLDEDTAHFLRLRMKTFYNLDYFERIVLPLLDIPQGGRVLDVGCGTYHIRCRCCDYMPFIVWDGGKR